MNSRSDSLLSLVLRLLKPFWIVAVVSTLMGVMSGVTVAVMLSLINKALQSPATETYALLAGFAGLCLISLIGEIISDMGTNQVGQRIIAFLRKELSARIVAAPVAQLERYRAHRLIAVLSEDVDTVSDLTFIFSSVIIAIAVTFGCLAYMAVLSWQLFLLTFAAVVIGALAFDQASVRASRLFATARGSVDEMQKHYRAIIEGAKELRLNRHRRERVFGTHLAGAIDDSRRLKLRATYVLVSANAFASVLFFLVVGLILLWKTLRPGEDATVFSGFVLVMLYLKGPLSQIIGAVPLAAKAKASVERIVDMSEKFAGSETGVTGTERKAFSREIRTIELGHARYAFPSVEGSVPFELGPIDLQIERGETVFIVGENGCGKTTLVKLLLGLYQPVSGQLRVNGEPVEASELDDYRQLFSAVFTDYFLFDEIVAADTTLLGDAARYLERLEIADKVTIRDGVFSTLDLSTGQRKRLALIHTYLEDRPFMVFDEWAADQDPTFRRIFYTEILPDLKKRGKTLIVISHDDRYFDAADRCIRLASGKIAGASDTTAMLPALEQRRA